MAQQNPQNITPEQIKAFAASAAGKKLLAMLEKSNAGQLQEARRQAAVGNMEQAKLALSAIMNDPAVQQLLQQFGGGNG